MITLTLILLAVAAVILIGAAISVFLTLISAKVFFKILGWASGSIAMIILLALIF